MPNLMIVPYRPLAKHFQFRICPALDQVYKEHQFRVEHFIIHIFNTPLKHQNGFQYLLHQTQEFLSCY